jgi:hypothetical protein
MERLPIEDRLALSNIGFRSQSCIAELVKIKERQPYNPLVLETAESIVDYCDMITSKKQLEVLGVPMIYFRFLLDDKPAERIETIRQTKSTLEKIARKKEVSSDEIDSGINFFQELSNKCLEYLGANRQI